MAFKHQTRLTLVKIVLILLYVLAIIGFIYMIVNAFRSIQREPQTNTKEDYKRSKYKVFTKFDHDKINDTKLQN